MTKRMEQMLATAKTLHGELSDLRHQATVMRRRLLATIGCERMLPKPAGENDVCGMETEITELKEFLAEGRRDMGTESFHNAVMLELVNDRRGRADAAEAMPVATEPVSPEMAQALAINRQLRSEKAELDVANHRLQLALAVKRSERALTSQPASGFLSS